MNRLTKSLIPMVLVASAALASVPVEAHAPLPGENGKVPTLAPVLKDSLPAVVNISTRSAPRAAPEGGDPRSQQLYEFFRHFFPDMEERDGREFQERQPPRRAPQPRGRGARSIGSGVIVDAQKGLILTNHHVVQGADEITISLKDTRTLDAELVGSDPETDIAVLKVDAPNLKALKFANSDQLNVGDYVVAIGNPFGLSHTVTSGIVSAMGRSGLGLEGYEDFIQTDASINPGNSGGALINLRGELVGINTAIFSRSGGNMGIGFAIPVNMAKSVMDQLIEYGEVKRGRMGIMIQNITPDLAEAFDLGRTKGALVSEVVDDSPADKAGLKSGDIVTHFNGKEIKSSSHLKNLVGLLRLGDKATVKVLRDGRTRTLTVTIADVDNNHSTAEQSAQSVDLLNGTRFTSIPPEHPLKGEVDGVYVSSVEYGSAAWEAGVREGDVISSVNQKDVDRVDELIKYAKEKDDTILVKVWRGNGSLFLVIK